MKIATFNCNSVRVRVPIITWWLQKHQPDILALQEIKVDTDKFPYQPFQELGYHCVVRGKGGYSGVATLSKVEPDEVRAGFGDGDVKEEPRIIVTEHNKIFIINTYVPQGQDIESEVFQYKLEWLRRFRKMLDEQFSSRKKVLWLGDFNVAPEGIDVYDSRRLMGHPDHNPQVFEALENVRSWGFIDLFRKFHAKEEKQYTYWDYRMPGVFQRNIGWRVDHIFVTKSLGSKARDCWIDREPRGMEKPSDHTFMVAEFDLG